MLYKLNFESYDQVKKMIQDLRGIFPERKLYMAIDQEGGEIDRINQVTKGQTLKSPRYYGRLAEKNLAKAKKKFIETVKKPPKS